MTDVSHDVSIENHTPIPEHLTDRSLKSLMSYVLDQEGASGRWTLSFRFTTDQEIQRMHVEFMGVDSPTDIMTFPYHDSDDPVHHNADERSVGGDIVVSVDRASNQAADAGWPVLDELWFLSIHGVLHLVGWDDQDAEARAAMLERQSELLEGWKRNRKWETGANEEASTRLGRHANSFG